MVGLGIGRAQPKGLVVCGNRLGGFPLAAQSQAQIVMRLGVRWAKPLRLAIAGDRLIEPAGQAERVS
jgi:hypothetical protein